MHNQNLMSKTKLMLLEWLWRKLLQCFVLLRVFLYQHSGKNSEYCSYYVISIEPIGSSPPKVPKESKSNTFSVGLNEKLISLTCPGQAYPVPSFRYYLVKFIILVILIGHLTDLDFDPVSWLRYCKIKNLLWSLSLIYAKNKPNRI